jgi:hypothetical protein
MWTATLGKQSAIFGARSVNMEQPLPDSHLACISELAVGGTTHLRLYSPSSRLITFTFIALVNEESNRVRRLPGFVVF